MTDIEKRKMRHIRVSLEEDVESEIGPGFNDVHLIHRALPEINLSDIDTSIELFGKKLKMPIIISAITGGTTEAKEINRILARVTEKMGLALCVGSQRIAIEQPETVDTFSVVREEAPTSLIMGNLGCPQLSLGWGIDEAKKCVKMIEADALAIHMNPLQEAIQINGDTNYRDVISKVGDIVHGLSVPVVMKETGCGIAYEEALKLEKIGVGGIETSGLGGTNWAAVEYHIAKELGEKEREDLGKVLINWGVPTVISIVEIDNSTRLKIIASGGIRTGIEVAKAIALGADTIGIAKPFLKKAVEGEKFLENYVKEIIRELKVVMFLVGAKNICELRKAPVLILGRTREWLRLRGFDPKNYSLR